MDISAEVHLKTPSYLLPHLIPLSSKNFFAFSWLSWRELEAHWCVFHWAKRGEKEVCRQSHKTCIGPKETATFLVGKKEYSVIPKLWAKPLGWGGDWSWTLLPHPHLCHRNGLVGRNAHDNKSCWVKQPWGKHQIPFLLPVRYGWGGNLLSGFLSRWSMAHSTTAYAVLIPQIKIFCLPCGDFCP